MPDILIRDVPEDVVNAIEQRAQRSGLSRAEYLRRVLARERSGWDRGVTVADLERFATVFVDLTDPDLMSRAWA